MSSLDKANQNLKFDKRLIEWNLNNGQLTQEEYKKYLESLPDLGNNVELLNWGEEKSRQDAH